MVCALIGPVDFLHSWIRPVRIAVGSGQMHMGLMWLAMSLGLDMTQCPQPYLWQAATFGLHHAVWLFTFQRAFSCD